MRLDSCYVKNSGEYKEESPYFCGECSTAQPDDKSTIHILKPECSVGQKEKLGEVLAYVIKEIIKELKC